ncbi:MAG: clostripain-related cysteine peptidase [Ferruginibacter sp.]
MRGKNKKKWTVFFLVKCGSSIVYARQMINEIRSMEIRDRMPVIFCIYLLKSDVDLILGKSDYISKEPEPGFITIFCKLVADNADKRFKNKLEIISKNEKFDITNPADLEDYFRNDVLMHFEATHYLMISWDHGRSVGIFDNKDPLDLEREQFLNKEVGYLEDKILTMEELNDAIELAFGKKKIDIFIMMNCFMQFIDAGYALRRSVKYLIAPETDIFMDGYNYPFIFQLLIENSNMSPKKIAKHIVRSFTFKVYPTRDVSVSHKKSIAIFAVDLRYYSLLAKSIDQLVGQLLKKISEVKDVLVEARCITEIRGSNKIYDFYAFIDFLVEKNIFMNDVLAASLLLSLRELIVIEKFIGKGFSIRTDDGVNSPSGFTIFIPVSSPGSTPDPDHDLFFETDFYKKTKWHMFINELINS